MAIKVGGHCCLDCRSWHNAESSGQDGQVCSAIAVSHCEGLADTLIKDCGYRPHAVSSGQGRWLWLVMPSLLKDTLLDRFS